MLFIHHHKYYFIVYIIGLNVFIKDNQQAYCLLVVLQQNKYTWEIYMESYKMYIYVNIENTVIVNIQSAIGVELN